MKIVIDTNVLVSSFLRSGSYPHRVVARVLAGQATLCLSQPIFTEYHAVLTRPKFAFLDQIKIQKILKILRAKALWVEPTTTLHRITDADGNRFLECASTAHAAYLITGNTKHFNFSEFEGTQIIQPRDFVDLFAPKD